jgi:hypothetical protein
MSEQSQNGDGTHRVDAVRLLRAQVRELHHALDDYLSEWLRGLGTLGPPRGSRPVGLYVHAATVEDISIQTLLRGVAPLFATQWAGRGPADYATTDLGPIRQYARDVFAATEAYLTGLTPEATSRAVDLSRLDLGQPTVAWVVSRCVVLELAQIHGELIAACTVRAHPSR